MSSADEGVAGRAGGGKLLVAVLAADAAVLALVGFTHPDVIRFETVTADAVVHGLSVLVFVALIVERALEVWLTPLRGPDSDRLKHQIREREEAGDGAGAEDAVKGRASEHRRRLLEHRLETRRLAFVGGLTVGVVVSALGVRALGQFVDPGAFEQLPGLQQRLFTVADVLLTGALLGGGADGIHKILSRFLEFFGSE